MQNKQLIEGSRERVIKSTLNTSTSKQLWTFPKKKRFVKIKAQCPHSAYQTQLSTLNQHYPKFSHARRTFFNQSNQDGPSPGQYEAKRSDSVPRGVSFGQSRQKCTFSAYLEQSRLTNPAPTDYEKYDGQEKKRSSKGFTMRPKTAHAYNYFLEDKEQLQHPGPSNYDTTIDEPGKGKGTLAKFRSTQTGGIMVRSQRFLKTNDTPGPASYEPKKISMRSYCQGSMGRQSRSSWIDRAIRKSHSPGPGDYVLPSDFGHLTKLSKKRLMTIQ